MAKDSSFDIVSKVDMPEINNAVQQAQKELANRFDFKNSKSLITLEEGKVILISDDDFKLSNVVEILESKLVKRGVSLRSLEFGETKRAAGDTVRQEVTLRQGISQDKSKLIIKCVKDSKLKVTSSIQGEEIRLTGKNKDDLQAVMALLRKEDFGIELQFVNYR